MSGPLRLGRGMGAWCGRGLHMQAQRPQPGQPIALAMSGGVDSSVSAFLLKQQGYKVTGFFVRSWDEREERGQCPAAEDFEKVQHVCEHLGLEGCVDVDLTARYWTDVFSNFLEGIEAGLTPNPDLTCNHKIKFSALRDHAAQLGVQGLATGHYAQLGGVGLEPPRPGLEGDAAPVQLRRGVDDNKDQTYFLAGLPQSVLRSVLFPIGHLTKTEVRAVAMDLGLDAVARQRESMGICFIGKRQFTDFILEYLPERPGLMVDLEGRPIGEHRGYFTMTLGQRARITSQLERLVVVGKDVGRNQVVVGPTTFPGLFSRRTLVTDLRWTSGHPPGPGASLQVRTRHRAPLCGARLSGPPLPPDLSRPPPAGDALGPVFGHVPGLPPGTAWAQALDRLGDAHATSTCVVDLDTPIRAVTPGQVMAIYDGDVCLGGGVIAASQPHVAL